MRSPELYVRDTRGGHEYIAPGRRNRQQRHHTALSSATYHACHEHRDLDSLADVMSTARDGRGWAHWWGALVNANQPDGVRHG